MLNGCDLYEISALRPLINLEFLSISQNNIYYFYPIRSLDCEVEANYNLHTKSSDFFSFFDVKNKSAFIKKQPSEQQTFLAEKMKSIDITTSYVRDINAKRKNCLSKKQSTANKLVLLQQKQSELFLQFTNQTLYYFKMLEGQFEQYQ
ncbi:Hypothetical_protein [Hexamita inflata]|uniref:Hypothetical_protein n=1 Tax=Hexamita inflata TaxID=28002 RepID=A0AA86RPL7_9EUKA|nr:Hypothetical protein HINF_LOCUS57985 [Hexamita inflata]